MVLKTFHFLLFLTLVPGAFLFQSTPETPRVDVPLAGDEVRGVVGIAGSTNVEGFDHSEVFFGFSPDGAWFSLGSQTTPVNNQIIVNWDTTSIPDGTYRLRVVVTKTDGSQAETLVDDIHVRNYSSGDQNRQNSGSILSTPVADYNPASNRTATPLPKNPAALTRQDIFTSLRAGALGTTAVFLILGLYLGLRWLNKRK